jgi:hypothetical protein
MTGKTGASVGPKILEKRIFCGDRGAPGLKGLDLSAGIRILVKFWYVRWRGLGALNVMMRKEIVHLLHVLDEACGPIDRLGRVDNPLFLRQCRQQQAAYKKDSRTT